MELDTVYLLGPILLIGVVIAAVTAVPGPVLTSAQIEEHNGASIYCLEGTVGEET
jgi:hypothetical protein